MSPLALGLDLGSSGLRLALAETTPDGQVRLLREERAAYPAPFAQPQGWIDGLISLVCRLDPSLRCRIDAIAVDGTSGTLLRCRPDGSLLPGEAGLALPYHLSCPEQSEAAQSLCGDPTSPAASASGSLARALRLLACSSGPQSLKPGGASASGASGREPGGSGQDPTGHGPTARSASQPRPAQPERPSAGVPAPPGSVLAAAKPARPAAGRPMAAAAITAAPVQGSGQPLPDLLRHQADWLMGWLLGDWRWGEEGNNLRLGWDLERCRWSGSIADQPWASALPRICASGSVLGRLSAVAVAQLGLNPACVVVAGSTDANAGVLAADPQEGDGITVLGTTLVLKQFVDAPIRAPGVSCHRVGGRWLVGGASNAGAGILRRFFADAQIAELSRQIDPRRPSGLALLPLPQRGERFPIDDPQLEPRLEPRPVSDALYLQALLEGLTDLERQGWQRLAALGAPPLRRVLTLGGGARNPQWRTLRQRALGVPVLLRPQASAALGMARLALQAVGACG